MPRNEVFLLALIIIATMVIVASSVYTNGF